MKRKMMLLVTATICAMMCLTGCNSSDETTGSISGTILESGMEAIEEVEDAMNVETEAPADEVTEAPAEPTPEPTATPEPTLAPIEWTTEEGTLLPTELIVIVKGSPVKLPCTVSEYMERTGEKIFKSDVTEGKDCGMPGIASITLDNYQIGVKVPDDAESFKDYIIFHIITSNSMCDENHFTDITLPGDIHLGSQLYSYSDIEAIYGKCDGPFEPLWWNVESDNPGWTADPDVVLPFEKYAELERGYGIEVDCSRGITGIDIKVSDDKLKELYGN